MALQMLAGFHAVRARIRHAASSIKELYIEEARRDKRMQSFIEQAESQGLKIVFVDKKRLDTIARGVRHQGVVAMATEAELAMDVDELLDLLEDKGEKPLLLLLDSVTDPHNLGACLRSADAAGCHAVIAPRDRAVGLNATVRRVACGAAETTPYLTVTNLARTMRSLKERDVWVVGTDDQAENSIHDIDVTRGIAWVMGAEGEGMRRLTRETCDELVSIPMIGSVESLNVSVASAVCLYESVRQRRSV
ncbi:23S rRNA (guanosine(2251)-2'-O)-methyltransferase RlmB [Paenalcaligenes niemegkensis]|uniref:23S rRNA (guanosine(2251)-2'-O)-methyltransferase RlmB n=1 Tax=Paenalcaligenes niemegkensis TaxID=2895469 RepID=UPI002150E210